jgi:regulator of protease activity HflC (stomatin/prohibitin superfamily)
MKLDLISAVIAKRNTITWVALVFALVGVILSTVFNIWWGWSLFFFALGFILLINSLVVIKLGHAGYLLVLGNNQKESFKAGLHLVFPFISVMHEVDVRLQVHNCTGQKINAKNEREVTIGYTLNYCVNPELVHLLPQYFNEDNVVDALLCPWLNNKLNLVIKKFEYEEITQKIQEIQEEIQVIFENDIRNECRKFETNSADKDIAEKLFTQITVLIQSIDYDTEYQKAVANVSVAEKEILLVEKKKDQKRLIAEANAEALKIGAEAEADAIKKKAEAEAEALRLKGASENEVKEKLGEILKTHPELLKEVLAKNFPKVYGGSNIINLDNLLSGAN